MASRPLLTEGEYVETNGWQAEANALRREIQQLRIEMTAERKANVRAAIAAISNILITALQQNCIDDNPVAEVDAKSRQVWESWKQRLGEGPAKVIDALLLHGELNTQQLAIATGYHRTTVPAFVHKLNKAGLLNKNGGRFSLKEL